MPVALYREYRPRTFAQIVGQEHVSRTLINALNEDRLSHAYLFCGPRGTGKTSTARVLAKALNCPNAVSGLPCGECPACASIARGEGVDVIEMDAASNRGIEEIRTLRDRIRLAPVSGKYKVYVIDEVHMLTNEAFNALLKTLEEPPANVVFILCTTEAYRVPPTILSRCQRFDFHRLPTDSIVAHLAEVAGKLARDVDPAALRAIGRAATGSMRDALGILDQCLAYTQGPVGLEDARAVLGAMDAGLFGDLTDSVLAGDVGSTWRQLDQLLEQGRDPREVARALGHHFRDLLLARLAGPRGEATGPLADDPERLARQAALVSEKTLYDSIDLFSSADAELRLAHQPRLVLEARLIKLCSSMPQNLAAEGVARPAPQAQPVVQPAASVMAPARRPAPARSTTSSSQPAPRQSRPLQPSPAPATAPETELPPLPEPPPEDALELPPESAHEAVPGPRPAPATEPVIETAPPRQDQGGVTSVSPPLLQRAWQGALAQLPETASGYLAMAVPEWDGRRVCVWLPEGMDWMAEYLVGKDICRRLAEGMSGTIGSTVGVVIQVRSRQSLFAPPERDSSPTSPAPAGRVAAGRTTSGDAQRPVEPVPTVAPVQGGQGVRGVPQAKRGEQDDDEDLRQAQLMFRAEEVSKGVDDR